MEKIGNIFKQLGAPLAQSEEEKEVLHKIGMHPVSLFEQRHSPTLARAFWRKAERPIVGPAGRPLANTRWQDELPKILKEFEIKYPADKRFWRLAKTNFSIIEQKVAYIREVMEDDRKKISPWQKPKLTPEYAGLMISLIFLKKK